MSVRKKFISGFGWQSVNVLTQIALQLVFISILARLISKDAFGIMAIALVVVGFIEIFSQIGIGPALIQRKDLTKEQINGAFLISVILGVGFFVFLYAISPMVANFYAYEPLTDILRVIGISFIISAVSIVPKSLIIKEMNFKQLFISSAIAMSVGNIGVGLTLAFMGYEVWAYVFALLSQNAIMSVCYWIFHPVKLKGKWSIRSTKPMIVYGGGSTLFNMFNYAASKIDTLIVGKFGGSDAIVGDQWAKTGLYDRSVYLMGLPITVLGKLSDSVMFSGLSMIQDEKEKLQRAFLSGTYFISMIVFPACVFMIFFAPEIVVLFLGKKYLEAAPLVQILFSGVAFRSLIKLSDSIVRALNAVYKASIIKAIFFLLVAAGAYIGLNFGLEGVAVGMVIAILVQYVLMMSLSLKLVHVNFKRVVRKMAPSWVVSFIVFSTCLVTTIGMSTLDLPYFIRLLVGIGTNAVILILFVIRMPWIFGQGNDNFIHFIIQKLPKNKWTDKVDQRFK